LKFSIFTFAFWRNLTNRKKEKEKGWYLVGGMLNTGQEFAVQAFASSIHSSIHPSIVVGRSVLLHALTLSDLPIYLPTYLPDAERLRVGALFCRRRRSSVSGGVCCEPHRLLSCRLRCLWPL